MIFSKYTENFRFIISSFTDSFFRSLTRLRQELTNLIVNQSKRIGDPLKSATFQSSMFDMLLQAMSVSCVPLYAGTRELADSKSCQKNQYSMSHPKAQSELAYWREREEESRRRMTSTASSRQNR